LILLASSGAGALVKVIRLTVFARETAPLIDYYRGRGILLELSTDRPAADVRAAEIYFAQ